LGFGEVKVGTVGLGGIDYLKTFGVFPNPIPGSSWFVYKGEVLDTYFPGFGDDYF
jgi:hypothetical protein